MAIFNADDMRDMAVEYILEHVEDGATLTLDEITAIFAKVQDDMASAGEGIFDWIDGDRDIESLGSVFYASGCAKVKGGAMLMVLGLMLGDNVAAGEEEE